MSSKMVELTKGLKEKSAKIRVLDAAGFSRSEIYKFLGIRYQHVRNVLVQDEVRRARKARAGQPNEKVAETDLRPTRVKIGPEGRVVIPAPFRDSLGLKEGDVLVASLENGDIRLATAASAIRRVQAMVRKYVPDDVSLVDELLDDRRREVEAEQRG